jgi:predicted dehydrogenase
MNYFKTFGLFLILSLWMHAVPAQTSSTAPVRLAVAGITHGHVPLILDRKGKTDVEVVGVYEPNTELAQRYAKRYNFDPALIYDDLKKMLDVVKPEAVAAFGSIYAHMAVVEACAPRGIHVMVEKPLATTKAHAERMEALAKNTTFTCLPILKPPGIRPLKKRINWCTTAAISAALQKWWCTMATRARKRLA